MRRSEVEKVKAEAKRLLEAIAVMENCSGWYQYGPCGNQATSKPHPNDTFNSGHAHGISQARKHGCKPRTCCSAPIAKKKPPGYKARWLSWFPNRSLCIMA
jgi:hypothetical protein